MALLCMSLYSCHSQQNAGLLSAISFSDKIQASSEKYIIDVRTPEEYSGGHVEEALLINIHDASFEDKISAVDKEKPCFVYCLSGGRSAKAAQYMREAGFKEVYELEGGILSWRNKGLPLTKPSSLLKDEISEEDYAKTVNRQGKVLVDFYAPWCAPCKKMEPLLQEVAKQLPEGSTIVRVDIDKNKELATKLGITEIPLFKLYLNGEEISTHQGLMEKDQLLKLLM